METYLWQSALLMLVAYFLGAVLGCLLRRLFSPAAPADVKPQSHHTTSPGALAATEFAASDVRTAPDPVQPKIETVAQPTPPQEATISESARFERVLTAPPAGTRPSSSAPPPAEAKKSEAGSPTAQPTASQAAAATAAAASAAAAAVAVSTEPSKQKASDPRMPTAGGSTGQAAVTATIATQPADDLRKIRFIDDNTATSLNQLGFTRFADIAGWTAEDANRVRTKIGHRADLEGWIEQAKMLADGKQTYHQQKSAGNGRADHWLLPSAPLPETVSESGTTGTAETTGASGVLRTDVLPITSARRQHSAPVPSPAPAPTPVPAPAPAIKATPEDFLKIEGIDTSTQDLLNANGVTSYNQISKWTAAEVEKFDALLGKTPRISRQNWIEQAKVLAGGKQTLFSLKGSSPASTATAPVRLAQPMSLKGASVGSTASTPATTSAPSTGTAESASQSRPGSIAASGGVATAPLQSTEKLPTTSASAAAAAARPARLAEAIRQNSQTGSGATSAVSGMRSVRSELLSNEARKSAGEIDDLKKVRGIGVLIEKKLNAMGVYSYEQIANWSSSDIERISNSLDFKGRIEREAWIEQARILASGGQTEFSKRLN